VENEQNANAPLGDDTGLATQTTTEVAPVVDQGQAGDTKTGDGQAQAPKPDTTEERFLTLDDVPENLREHVAGLVTKKEREMQAAFTKKTQAIAKERNKIEAYNAFEANPIDTLSRVAQNLGYQLTRADQGQQMQQQKPGQQYGQQLGPDWQPDSWDQVMELAESRAEQRILQKLQPVLAPLMQNVEKIRSDTIESQLEKIDPNWKIYEDEIKESLKMAPNLIQTPQGIAKLYRMSVPEDVLTSRATQTALHKFAASAKSAAVGSKSQTTKTTVESKVESFNDAVQAAKRQLGQI
jgi:hypothetical protein